jgi:hypothetical protein
MMPGNGDVEWRRRIVLAACTAVAVPGVLTWSSRFRASYRERRARPWVIVSGYTAIDAVVKAELFPPEIRARGPFLFAVSDLERGFYVDAAPRSD